jgi:hypothetical protein
MLNAKLILTTSFQDEDVTLPDAEQQDKPKTAFDKLMDRQSSTAVRSSSKLPLILQVCSLERGQSEAEVKRRLISFSAAPQHSGHSRTIVGYEINAHGSTNLLLFDPGRLVAD